MDHVVNVIGGTYRERCLDPALDRLGGSGLRGAGILHSLGDAVEFTTLLDPSIEEEAQSVATTLGFNIAAHTRQGPITFTYETPLSPTQLDGGGRSRAQIAVSGDIVVGFGMVEADWHAVTDTLVLDPQHSNPKAVLDQSTVGRCALVLNELEVRSLTGMRELVDAAHVFLVGRVSVVVVKQGAVGGIVVDHHTTFRFGAVPTATVCPIGSGDAFTAGFAHAWSRDHSDPAEAARFASNVAAVHSLVGAPQIFPNVLTSLPAPLPHPAGIQPAVYLAGPFFSIAERHLIRQVRAALINLGVTVVSPFHDIGLGGDEVAEQDLTALRQCHSIIALLDGADPGTLFEVGWATQADITTVGFAETVDAHEWTMLRGTGTHITNDLSTACYLAAWAAISKASSA